MIRRVVIDRVGAHASSGASDRRRLCRERPIVGTAGGCSPRSPHRSPRRWTRGGADRGRHAVVLRSTRAADEAAPAGFRWRRGIPISSCVTAVEDARFWEHPGVDPLAVARAGADTSSRPPIAPARPRSRCSWRGCCARASGGGAPRSARRFWARRLERQSHEAQISAVLNRVQPGRLPSVSALRPTVFGAAASEISLGEAAMLAGLRTHRRVTIHRVSPGVRGAAERRPHQNAPGRGDHRIDAERARAERSFVAERTRPFSRAFHVAAAAGAPCARRRSGVRLSTPSSSASSRERDAPRVEMPPDGSGHAALVVLDNRSGDVLAWVGSPDFWATRNGQRTC